MKCCFCGAELDKQIKLDEHYACLNTENCEFSFMVLPKKWWQALIDGKAAQDALKIAVETLRYIASGESSEWEDSTITAMKAIKEIASITTQEKE